MTMLMKGGGGEVVTRWHGEVKGFAGLGDQAAGRKGWRLPAACAADPTTESCMVRAMGGSPEARMTATRVLGTGRGIGISVRPEAGLDESLHDGEIVSLVGDVRRESTGRRTRRR